MNRHTRFPPLLLILVGLAAAVTGSVLWYLDVREPPLPEGAIAGASMNIVVGDGSGFPWPVLLTGVGAVLLLIGVVWTALRRRARRRAAADVPEGANAQMQ